MDNKDSEKKRLVNPSPSSASANRYTLESSLAQGGLSPREPADPQSQGIPPNLRPHARRQLGPGVPVTRMNHPGKTPSHSTLGTGSLRTIRPVSFGKVFEATTVRSAKWPIFYEGLATLFGAGISLDQALILLGERVDDPILSALCSRLHHKLISGVSLSAAMEGESGHIPEFHRRLIHAGEASGKLNHMLKQLARHEVEQHRLKSKLQSMLTYPALLISSTVVLLLMVSHHLAAPILATLNSAGQSLPWFLAPVFALSAAANTIWFWLAAGTLLGLAWRFLDRTVLKQLFWSGASWVPGLKEVLSRIAEERFARAFALLLASGLRVDKAVTHALEVTATPHFAKQSKAVVTAIENGANLSQALRETEIFSPTLLSMIEVGEESGTVSDLVGRAAEFHAQSLDADLQAAVSAAEPILLVGTGLLVGVFVLSMMVPLSQAIQTLG